MGRGLETISAAPRYATLHCAQWGINALVCTCQVPLAACHPCTSSVTEPQRPLVEGDHLLDMAVPVVPCVRAGELGVFVRDAELLEVAMESAVFLQEPILQSAVETEGGEEPAVHRCGERIRIVGASARRGAKDAAHFLCDLGALDSPSVIERRGEGDGPAQELRVFARQTDRRTAAHPHAPDHPPLPPP